MNLGHCFPMRLQATARQPLSSILSVSGAPCLSRHVGLVLAALSLWRSGSGFASSLQYRMQVGFNSRTAEYAEYAERGCIRAQLFGVFRLFRACSQPPLVLALPG